MSQFASGRARALATVPRPSALLTAVGLLAALLLLAAPSAQAATPAKVGPPNSIVAMGDSITKAFHSGSWTWCPPYANTDCPGRSWSTGWDEDVNSHYLRIRASNSAINGRNYNVAETGAKVDRADDQARNAVASNAELVTMLIGANDVCTSTEGGMTTVATFRSRVAAALDILRTGLPNSRIYVVSIPDIKRLWSIGKDSGTARLRWSTLNVCQSMLANPTSTSAADNARRDRVSQRNQDFNAVLQEECDKLVHCRHDGGAAYRVAFTSSDMSNLDFFHPNVDGQRDAAAATWSAGYNYTDRTAPVTTIAPTRAPDGRDNWYRDDVPVRLTATDNVAVDGTEYFYKLQGAVDTAWRRYTGPFTISDEGVTEISARSVDVNGNVEASKQSLVRIDKTAPVFALDCPSTAVLGTPASYRVVGATDDRSGFAEAWSAPRALDTTVPGLKLPNEVELQDRAGNVATRSCSYDVTYPAPGTPVISAGTSPNAGAFTLGWGAPAGAADLPLRYTVERRPAAGGMWSPVASDLDGRTRAFTAGDRADEGRWVYRVKGADDEQSTPWSADSGVVVVDQTGPNAPSVTTAREPEYAGDGGWFADEVTVVTKDAGDQQLRDGGAGTGVDPTSVAGPETLKAGGSVSRTVLDRVGNRSAATELAVQVDDAAPAVDVTCPETVDLLSEAQAKVTASDGQSGLRDDPSGSVELDTTKLGPQVTSRTATDNVGHEATATCTTTVEYPTPGTPAVGDGENPNAGAYTVGWKASAPASYPIRYVVERRAATDDGEWAQVAGDLADPSLAFTAGTAADEGTWRYRVKGVDGDLETDWSPASEPVVVDQSAPAAPSITADRAPDFAGGGGWYRDQVTLSTADQGDPALRDGTPGTGVDPASVAAPQTLKASGTVSRTVLDRVGNRSAAAERAVQVDATAPSLALDCPTSVVLRGSASVAVRAADAGSGLAQDPTGSVAVDTAKVGPQVIERTAVDNVGLTRTERCTVLVRYEYGGLERPVNRDGSSLFKLGSTVPLKLKLTDAAGTLVTDAQPTVQLERTSSTPAELEVEEVVEATPTNGKAFTFDGTQYHFNLSTKPLSTGTWTVKITLDDGTVHRTKITLR